MLKQAEMSRKLGTVFNPQQANVLSEVITEAYSDLVKTGDFNELKEIVPVVITHYARPQALERADEEGIIVVQSFEW